MLTYLLQKLDEIKRQRNLYCSKDATTNQNSLKDAFGARDAPCGIRPSPALRCVAEAKPTAYDAPERALKGKELFLYQLICKNLREK